MNSRRRLPAIQEFYQAYLVNLDTATFVRRVAEHYSLATLERLIASGGREARRAATLALGMLGDYSSNYVLGEALRDADRTVRMLAEQSIRKCWRRIGNDSLRDRLTRVCDLNQSQQFGAALPAVDELLKHAPWMAEAWNQRAIALFSLGRPAEAISACREALELNPYHFDAAAGMAQCYLQLGRSRRALECLRRALRLNPGLEAVRTGIEYLERRVARPEE